MWQKETSLRWKLINDKKKTNCVVWQPEKWDSRKSKKQQVWT